MISCLQVVALLLSSSFATTLRFVSKRLGSHLRFNDNVTKRLSQLKASGWALPFPRHTAEFEAQHQCLRVRSSPWTFLPTEAWQGSSDRTTLRQALSHATESFTKTALMSVFAARKAREADTSKFLLSRFACHARNSGLRPLIFVMTAETKQIVESHPPLVGVHLPELLADLKGFYNRTGKANINDFSENFVYLARWPLVEAVLAEGVPSVLTSDIDVAWLGDPRPHLSTHTTADALVAMDSQHYNLKNNDELDSKQYLEEKAGTWASGDHVNICCRGAFPFNSGQTFFRATLFAKALLGRIVDLQGIRFNQDHCIEDQDPMQWALYDLCASDAKRCGLLDPNLFMDTSLAKRLGSVQQADLPFAIHFDCSGKEAVMTERMKVIHDRCAV